LRYPLAERLLLGPKLFELCNRVATRLVSLDQVFHQRLRLPASPLGGPYLVWIDAEHLDINHRASLTSKVRRSDLIVIARAIPTLAITRIVDDPARIALALARAAMIERLWSVAPRTEPRFSSRSRCWW